ncbi:hypothetical protein OV090_39490 [Nannocystis sp. RBIL2]|uniref:hypothetical protein n=1 Tax=Nannocystis sp. RBIL2 TaxID=2996788 RepID=UPI00226ECE76|nr:hypothetical protein [Nannocystis sp. RBIL2]MCY1070891.1 hypothetical protein [Nannocystis sp. RBIL2]
MVSVVSVLLWGAAVQPVAGARAEEVAAAPETARVEEVAPGPGTGSAEEAAAVVDPFTPVDTEVPEPAGMGKQLREYRKLEAITGLDLSGAWESYEDDVREGETETFLAFARRRFKLRRALGIGVTCWGVVALGFSSYLWVETARAEVFRGQGILGFAAAATTAGGIGALVTGLILWSRWAAPLRDLRDAGLATRGRPIVGPLVLPRGGGLGLRLAF